MSQNLLKILVQWEQNSGKCGVCGDAHHLPMPRPHEAGGDYGKGIISRRYAVGQVINFYHITFFCSATAAFRTDHIQFTWDKKRKRYFTCDKTDSNIKSIFH